MLLADRSVHSKGAAGFDVETLRSRVTLVQERLVLFREIPFQTPRTVDVMFDRLEELTEPWPTFVVVLDLRGIERPGAEARQQLLARMRSVHSRFAHLAVAVGADPVLRAVAKVVAVTLGFSSTSFHATLEQAMDAAHRALRE
jgi:hypothetical protein